MTTYIAIPVTVAILILSVGIQLFDIAYAASDKAIAFSDDMASALDCAVKGIDISICSPNFDYTQEFKKDAIETKETLIQIQKELEEEYNITETTYKLNI